MRWCALCPQFWDTRDGELVKTFKGHAAEVLCVRYSSNELFLISAGSEGAIFVWDLISSQIIRRLRGHADIIVRWVHNVLRLFSNIANL